MTAGLTEALVLAMQSGDEDGQIVVCATAQASLDTSWSQQFVAPFQTVPIDSANGWTLRISGRVLEQIRAEMARYAIVETGGVMIGMCNARLKAIIVVDLVAAPSDSTRSKVGFTLGTSGLMEAIQSRHRATGGSLFDVGTWHSHLAHQGPSQRDRETARELAVERPPPSVLLIATPVGFYALMHAGTGT